MKGVVLAILLIHCFVVFGKPRPKRPKRTVNPNVNLPVFRKNQLNLHNHYRQLHRAPPMTLDPVLTKEAQAYAEHLKANNLFRHCGATTCNPSGAGESLANVVNATLHWYREVYDYNYCAFPQGRATTRPGSEGKMIFHFTQVVWSTTTKLGIGFAQTADGKKTYVVARYSPPGNFFGQFSDRVPRAPYLLNRYQDNCNAFNGGFTAWSTPGPCSKQCGGGIRYQTRSCTNPKPSFNGRDCSGETKRVYPFLCNPQACPTVVDERAQQCQARGYSAKSYNFGGASECTLYCEHLPKFYLPKGKVNDGTTCQAGKGACIDGVCTLLSVEPTPATTAAPRVTRSVTTKAPTNRPPVTTMAAATTKPPTTRAPMTTKPPVTTTKLPTTPPTTLPPINGGYSDWHLPGPCSKTCGGGISFRTRTCIAPQPGGGCIGPSREVYKIWCNPQPCDPSLQERNLQCFNRGHEPLGHNFGGVDECYLYCGDSQSGYFFYRGAVDPGTPCNNSVGACVDNVCLPMGYEQGTVIQGMYSAVPSNPYWKNIILAIPNGATNVQIIHNNHDAEAVVGYRSSTSYGYDSKSSVKGVTVMYHINSDITIDGPVYPRGDSQLVVYALEGDRQADIMFKYTPASIPPVV